MRKKFPIIILVVLIAATASLISQNRATDEEQVQNVIEDLGEKMKNIPLSGTKEIYVPAMDEHYKDIVCPDLVEHWKNNSTAAPGRQTSSPWPERIEVLLVKETDENTFEVKGEVVEVTSGEGSIGEVGRYPVMFIVQKEDDKWLIHDYWRQ